MTLTLHEIPANHFVAMETDGVVEEPHVTFDGDERPSFFPLVFSSVAVADLLNSSIYALFLSNRRATERQILQTAIYAVRGEASRRPETRAHSKCRGCLLIRQAWARGQPVPVGVIDILFCLLSTPFS